ncbi:hypothetical protein NPIL_199031 [Nephila pilipes]|uniref:Uncharacterized protein n=1 Tax=Nephila pilipes TaxID=299642 RepID=A0A8X6NQQ2_NEPPI|nr:hypothetical protein NPIL_199031 [Nephila pilipes]
MIRKPQPKRTHLSITNRYTLIQHIIALYQVANQQIRDPCAELESADFGAFALNAAKISPCHSSPPSLHFAIEDRSRAAPTPFSVVKGPFHCS